MAATGKNTLRTKWPCKDNASGSAVIEMKQAGLCAATCHVET